MTVHYEVDGTVVVVTIDRPEVANAIDRPTATELADCFRRYDADDALAVVVLAGANGTFCAGADLKAMQTSDGRGTRSNPTATDRSAPRDCCCASPSSPRSKATPSRVAWRSPSGVTSASLRKTQCSACTAGAGASRSWMGARSGWPDCWATATPSTSSSPVAACAATRRCVWAWPTASSRTVGRSTPRPNSPTKSPRYHSPLCAATECRRTSSGPCRSTTLLLNEFHHGMDALRTGEMFGGLERYSSGEWRTARA